jgi:hypothetical protein
LGEGIFARPLFFLASPTGGRRRIFKTLAEKHSVVFFRISLGEMRVKSKNVKENSVFSIMSFIPCAITVFYLTQIRYRDA